jgi:hypothetical protein
MTKEDKKLVEATMKMLKRKGAAKKGGNGETNEKNGRGFKPVIAVLSRQSWGC